MSSKNLIQIDHDACIFCRKCVRACPVSALKAEDRKIVVTEDCNLCTMCIGACPVGAIRMQMPTGKKAGGSIWVFVQCEDGHPLSVSLELIGRARELADGNGGEVTALVMEDGNPQFLQELVAHGADRVLCCSSRGSTGRQQVPELNIGIDRPQVAREDFGNDRNQAAGADIASDPEAVALWICELIKKREPDILLFGATIFGREVAPAVAARIGTGLTADCTGLELDPESGLL
ncbi:MAG: 4Fe-4S binding protein, partial [Lachnospiraceae bacterium]|nr:4Fe-4S binding protein [Lachnospiraceae bacterium]